MKKSIKEKIIKYFFLKYGMPLNDNDINGIETILHSEDESDPWCKVTILEDGFYLTDPNGRKIPKQKEMLIKQSMEDFKNGICEVSITLYAKVINP